MTAALGNTAGGTPFATGVDAFVYPQFIGYALRAPTTQDIYNPGTRWQNNSVNPPVQYYTVGAGLWYEYPNSSFGVDSVAGTTNEITASPTTGNVVLSIPSTFVAPGSIAATTTFTAGTGISSTTGNITATAGLVTGHTGVTATTGNVTATAGNLVATAGNLDLNGAASKIVINVGTAASASAGIGTLSSGVYTVATTAATASSLVFVSYIVAEASAGSLSAAAISGHVTITSSDLTDSTSTIQWFLIN